MRHKDDVEHLRPVGKFGVRPKLIIYPPLVPLPPNADRPKLTAPPKTG